jgi:ABC-2 type transport system ATP-binding protein
MGPMNSDVAVEVSELIKQFPLRGGGTLTAVDGVSFEVRRGEVFGFLGPNGAGKTTTLEIIEGLQHPTSGSAKVFGVDAHLNPAGVKERIGVQLQAGAYFEYLTLEEILDLFGSFYPRRVATQELLAKVELEDKAASLVKELSGGQKQRFSIIAAMVNDPDVVFLDEPTTGLDPQARHHLWELIQKISSEEKTVVLTTHYMEEAEILCDRVAIIDGGKIVALDAPVALVNMLPSSSRIQFTTPAAVKEAELAKLPGVAEVTQSVDGGVSYTLRVSHAREALGPFVDWARKRKIELNDVRVLPATLEDVFLSLTGHNLRD